MMVHAVKPGFIILCETCSKTCVHNDKKNKNKNVKSATIIVHAVKPAFTGKLETSAHLEDPA